MNIQNALQLLRKNGGFSYNFNTGELNPSFGYMVATSKDTERVIENITRYKPEAVEAEVKKYCQQHSELLMLQDNWLGAWIDDGKLYLDVSSLYLVEVEAIAACEGREQLAYYNNTLQKSIFLHSGTATGKIPDNVGFKM